MYQAYLSRSMVYGNDYTVINLPPVCAFCGDEIEADFVGFDNLSITHVKDGTPACQAAKK